MLLPKAGLPMTKSRLFLTNQDTGWVETKLARHTASKKNPPF